MDEIRVVYDRKNVTVFDGLKTVLKGADQGSHSFARNVIRQAQELGYELIQREGSQNATLRKK